MKKRIITIILVIIVVLITAFSMKVFKRDINEGYLDELKDEEKKVLIEKSYSNYAFKAQYKGKAIFNDGTIYSWNFNGNMKDFGNYNINSEDGLTKYILEKGKKTNKKVSIEDMEEIKKHLNNLEDTIQINHIGADQGSDSISVWNNNQEIVLSINGDSIGENKTQDSQKILSIIEKYL